MIPYVVLVMIQENDPKRDPKSGPGNDPGNDPKVFPKVTQKRSRPGRSVDQALKRIGWQESGIELFRGTGGSGPDPGLSQK